MTHTVSSAAAVAALLLALGVGFPATAHEGEDHGEAGKGRAAASTTTPAGSIAKAESRTEDIELLVALQGQRLILTVDRYASNEPVVDARVEVDRDGHSVLADVVGPGTYAIPGAPFATPGRHALAVWIDAADVSDLLAVTLEIAAPAKAAVPAPVAARPLLWAGAGAGVLVLAGAGLLTVRRRRNHPSIALES